MAEAEAAGASIPVRADQLFYIVTGAAAGRDAAPVQVTLLTGDDPFAAENIQAYTDAVVQLLFPAPPGCGPRGPRGAVGPTARLEGACRPKTWEKFQY